MTVVPEEASIDRSLHRLVAEESPDLHTVTTIDGVYRFVSPASFALFGWEPDDLVRRRPGYLHPSRRHRAGRSGPPGSTRRTRMEP